MGSGEQRGLQQALPLTDLLEQKTLGTVLRLPPKGRGAGSGLRALPEGSLRSPHPGALSPKIHHSPLGSLNSGSVFSWRVSGRVRDRDDSGIFWSELRIERKKRRGKKKAKAQSKMKKIKPPAQPCGSSRPRTVEPTLAPWSGLVSSGPMEAPEAGGENPK